MSRYISLYKYICCVVNPEIFIDVARERHQMNINYVILWLRKGIGIILLILSCTQ